MMQVTVSALLAGCHLEQEILLDSDQSNVHLTRIIFFVFF